MNADLMTTSPKSFRPQHQQPRTEVRREKWKADDRRRGSSAQRGYGARWQKARAAYLMAHPLCVCCEANGRATPATMVDHAVPHELDWGIFWKSEDWQSLCDDCNQRIKQPIELKWKQGKASDAELRLDRAMPELFF